MKVTRLCATCGNELFTTEDGVEVCLGMNVTGSHEDAKELAALRARVAELEATVQMVVDAYDFDHDCLRSRHLDRCRAVLARAN